MRRQHSPILVTGCPRSGTSMVAEVLQKCGAYTGDVSKPKQHNPRGMMEHIGIYEQVVKPCLIKAGACPAGQFPFPDYANLTIPIDWKSKIETILQKEGYNEKTPWMYKSNKSALLWKIWDYAFPEAKWIIVRRRTGDIIQSCADTSFMQAFKTEGNRKKIGVETEEEAWKWWVHQYEKQFVEMIEAGLNVKIVWPDRMVQGNYQQIYETIEWLGLTWNSEAPAVIDPKFWKVRKGAENNGVSNDSNIS